jgi:hypothetical protein
MSARADCEAVVLLLLFSEPLFPGVKNAPKQADQ